MFRHKEQKKEENQTNTGDKETKPEITANKEKQTKDVSPVALRELLEKNLKWSQIIYEQNRKINRKLFWYDFSGWLRLVIIVAPLVLAFIFIPPLFKDLWQTYGHIFQNIQKTSNVISPGQTSVDQLLKLLPVNPAQQEQIRQILK